MKETINISLSGVSFVIEKDAYMRLSVYMDNLELQYMSKEGGDEIIGDIEARIAEILMEDKDSITSVITLVDVEKVIEQMGYPESDSEFDATQDVPPRKKPIKKKLYRKKEGAVVSGVLNGFATFFNVDVIVLRVLFVLLFVLFISVRFLDDYIGFLFMAYFLFAIIIPKAKTVIQKLEMEGGDINVTNINNKYTSESSSDESGVLPILGKIFKFMLLSFAIIIGLFIIFLLGTLVFTAIVVSFSAGVVPVFFSWHPTFSFIAAGLSIAIPLVLLLLLFIKSIFSLKFKKSIFVILSLVWLGAVMVTIFSKFYQFSSINTLETTTTDIYKSKEKVAGKTLYVKMLGDGNETTNPISKEILYKRVHASYCEKTQDSVFRVTLTRSAKGINLDDARDVVNNINIPYKIVGDTLYLTFGFTIDDDIASNHNAYYTFYCPENCEIKKIGNVPYFNNFSNFVEEEKPNEDKEESQTGEIEIKKGDKSIIIKGTVTKGNDKDAVRDVVDLDIDVNK